jgi:hypothetical protein
MTIIITLTDNDLNICRTLGNLRTLVARGNKVKDAKMGNLSGSDIDEDGVIAEYAFCRHFNIFFDPSAYPRSGSVDCVYKGFKIDIKSTRHENGRLLATLKNNDEVDVYALAIITGREVRLVGWAYSKDLCKEENITNLGHGEGYALNQNQLREWKK